MFNIAIIPARGGSKRIPRKNIREFCGKPMIAWSIEAAKASDLFDQIIVSSDDDEIIEIARSYGASAPFRRPASLSGDYVGSGIVVKHAVEWVLNNIGKVDNVCTIYATAPFIRPSDLREGYELLQKTDCRIVFTITSYPFPIQRAIKILDSGRVGMFYPELYETRSQDLIPAYHDAGQFYWLKTAAVLNEVSTFSNEAVPLVLPRHQVQDIDCLEDWKRAEIMFRILNESESTSYQKCN